MIGHPEKVEPEIEGNGIKRRVLESPHHRVPNIRRGCAVGDTEETAGARDDHVKRLDAPVGEGASVVKRHVGGALDELVTEAALSCPRLRGQQDDSGPTRPGFAQSPLEQSELALAADEAREAARPGTVETAADPARTAQLEHAHGNARPFEALFPLVEEVEEARGEALGLLGHRDAARRGQLLHPGGEADDVPLRGVVHAQVVADPAHDDLARVQAHPHRELEPALAPHVFGKLAEVARQIQSGRTRTLRMVLVGDGGAEERHDAVTRVLVDGPLVTVNAAREDPEQAIEETMPFLGVDALRELHRAHDVGEEDGDQLALAPERALGCEDLLGEMSRRVGARLGGVDRRREGRATIVAEPRARGVLVTTRRAAHWTLQVPSPASAMIRWELRRLVIQSAPLDGPPDEIVAILREKPRHEHSIAEHEALVLALRDVGQVDSEAPAVIGRDDHRGAGDPLYRPFVVDEPLRGGLERRREQATYQQG